MLVTDETEGCLQRKTGKKKLSQPHSSSLIDLDGDCYSDLFVTVQEITTGKTFYEIYLRREIEQSEDAEDAKQSNSSSPITTQLKGLNTYCLVSREEVPS
jgi:hypothetical protein